MTDRGVRRGAGELEAQVMAALWASRTPLTTSEVQTETGGGLAYNTLQTILTRLTVKGLVERAERGRAHTYWPTKDGAASVAGQLRTTLSGVEDRAEVLREFASVLDDDEARILRQWLSSRTEES
ncbi:BlaI/MecI/CopY family transcriptional regulator [Kribbella sp. DT2]|uniref:BlaI/MecI/CopY family transcriptional regulator n=1 Tax=Kribbella sp. DT2 TaxID=3393427 RepID=UPI003CF0DAE6